MKNIKLFNYIFWYNPYENLEYAITRDTQLAFFNGNREQSEYISSSSHDTLVEIILNPSVINRVEKRVFKIPVDNIDDNDVEAYVNQVNNRLKRTPVVDPQTGQMDLPFSHIPIDQDFFIPVRTEENE
jgi:Bacteriophage T4-like portal protein (Gp20)